MNNELSDGKRKNMKDNTIFISDENGKEREMRIYLTFDMAEKQYVVVYEEGKEEDLYAFVYDDEGNLYAVDDADEMDQIEEVINSYGIEEEKED